MEASGVVVRMGMAGSKMAAVVVEWSGEERGGEWCRVEGSRRHVMMWTEIDWQLAC
jgi:hypothetical protein